MSLTYEPVSEPLHISVTTRNPPQLAEPPPPEVVAPVVKGKGGKKGGEAGKVGESCSEAGAGKVAGAGKAGKVVRDLTKKDKFFGLTPTQPVGLLGSQLILRSSSSSLLLASLELSNTNVYEP